MRKIIYIILISTFCLVSQPLSVKGANDIVSHANLGTNLIAYYTMDGNSNDSVGTKDGTDTNISYGAGALGDCAYNLSKTGKIALGSWELPAAFSVGGWVKMDSLNDAMTFFSTYNGGGTGSSVAQAFISVGTGEMGYSNFSVDIGWSTTKIDTGNWHSVMWTHDGTTARVYLDGTEVKNGTAAHAATTAVANLMSRGDNDQELDGYIDEVGIWSKTLTADDVVDFHNSGTPLPYEATAVGSSVISEIIIFE